MRSILPFLFLSACSDYEMVGRHEEPADVPATETDGEEPEVINVGDTAAETDTATVPVEDTEEPSEEDTGDVPVETDECSGFLINQPYDIPDVATESYIIFSRIGDAEIEVRQGETAEFSFAATAHECGDTVFTGFTVVQSTIATPRPSGSPTSSTAARPPRSMR